MPSGDQYGQQHAILDGIVFDPATRDRALADLRRYFRSDGPARELLTGRRFDAFADGGDTEDVRNEMNCADVLALSLLTMQRSLGHFGLDVLETHSQQISQLLDTDRCRSSQFGVDHDRGPRSLADRQR